MLAELHSTTTALHSLWRLHPSEYPQDDDAAPSYPEGSREATLLKIFNLLDKGGTGYVPDAEAVPRDYGVDQPIRPVCKCQNVCRCCRSTDVHTWREFVQQAVSGPQRSGPAIGLHTGLLNSRTCTGMP